MDSSETERLRTEFLASLEEALSMGREVANALAVLAEQEPTSEAVSILARFARSQFFFAGTSLSSLCAQQSPRVLLEELPLGVETEMVLSHGKDGTDFWLQRKGRVPKFLWRPQDLRRLPGRAVAGTHVILHAEGAPGHTARRCEVLPGDDVVRDLDSGETLAMPDAASVWALPPEAAGVAAHAVRCRLTSGAEDASLEGLRGTLVYAVARGREDERTLVDAQVLDAGTGTRRPLGGRWKVKRGAVSHVASPDEVFFHDDAAYALLLERMRDAYQCRTGDGDAAKVPVGDACAVQGLDNQWRRGKVRLWRGDVAEVYLMDTGELVKTTSYRLSPLRPRDAIPPPMARRFRLAGVRPSPEDDTIDSLKVLLPPGTQCEARRLGDSDGIILQPLETCISVNLQMVRAGVADLLSPGVATPPSTSVEGEVTHADSTSSVFVIFGDRSPLVSLEERINSHDHPKATRPKPGQLVLARYDNDRRWFRARLLDDHRLRFLDYGNVKAYEEWNVADIEPEFLQLPFQAVECSLAGWPPRSLSPSQICKAEEVFRSWLLVSLMKARIADRDVKPIRVSLTDAAAGHDITDALQAAVS